MRFREWLSVIESTNVQGGIRPILGGAAYQADYTVQDAGGNSRTFNSMFSYKNGEVHINWFGGEGDNNIQMPALIQQMASDVCKQLGPITNITYTPSGGAIRGTGKIDGSAVRERLFSRYIRQLSSNLPSQCQATQQSQQPQPQQPQQSRFANHPMRSMFKGDDDEFAQWFGLK